MNGTTKALRSAKPGGAATWPLGLRAHAVASLLVGAFGVALFAAAAPAGLGDWQAGLILAMSGLLVELTPAGRKLFPVRRAFRLPFVAGVAASLSPAAALISDVAIVGLGGLLRTRPEDLTAAKGRIVLNVAACCVSSTLAGAAWSLVVSQGLLSPWTGMVASICFVLAYGVAHVGMGAAAGALQRRGLVWEGALATLRRGFVPMALYGLLAATLSRAAEEGFAAYLVLGVAPMMALQYAMVAHAALFEHYYGTVGALVLMLQRVHAYTHGHMERVASIAENVALRLGLPPARARLVREAAVLHDIGKIAVNEEVLDKPGPLDSGELEHVRRHAQFGAEILAPVSLFSPIVPWVLHHHERPDGTGYPDRLKGEDIPVESRIIAVADAFDAMTDSGASGGYRRYRAPKTFPEALAELERCAGAQFDSRVVAAFVEAVWEDGET